jgi:hypothetical protein
MVEGDLAAVIAVADAAHPVYPEDAAVFAERLRLFPQGCAVLAGREQVLGYRIAHPWSLAGPPHLSALIGALPLRPATLLLHDLALSARARGSGHARATVEATLALAARERLPGVTLMAVAGTTRFWSGLGFREGGLERPAPDRDGYGTCAVAMVREVAVGF